MGVAAEPSWAKPEAYFTLRNDDILELLPDGAMRFLEAGCAAGRLGEEIKKRRPGAVVHGLEREASAAEEASRRLDRVFQIDLNQPLPTLEGPYDCVICSDILEHLVDPWTVLRRLVATLMPGGHVVASIPNVRHYKVLRDLVLRGRFRYREAGILDSTHLRFFTRHEMESLFTSAGLEVVGHRARVRGSNFWIRALDGALFGALKEFRAYQYVLVGRSDAPSTA